MFDLVNDIWFFKREHPLVWHPFETFDNNTVSDGIENHSLDVINWWGLREKYFLRNRGQLRVRKNSATSQFRYLFS